MWKTWRKRRGILLCLTWVECAVVKKSRHHLSPYPRVFMYNMYLTGIGNGAALGAARTSC